MLKVTTTRQDQTITLKLEGKLAGPWVQEVTRVWVDTEYSPRNGYVVDLRSVTFIDRPGQALLARMSRQGAQLIAADCLTRTIVDEIKNSTMESGVL
jgi:translation initiation factor IF-2